MRHAPMMPFGRGRVFPIAESGFEHVHANKNGDANTHDDSYAAHRKRFEERHSKYATSKRSFGPMVRMPRKPRWFPTARGRAGDRDY